MAADTRRQPVCTVIGGPNGSGKSTIFDHLTLPGHFVNADLVARGINPTAPEGASLAAGRQTLAALERLLAARESFVYETTLSSRQSLTLMRDAVTAGYEVGLIFVALNSPELNVSRVAQRVLKGGHHIPEDTIRRRYETALRRLPQAIRLAAGSMLFDNSAASGPRLLLRVRAGLIEANDLDARDPFHARLASAVGEALAMPAAQVLRAAKPPGA